jgi:hypothetical protein
MESPGGRCDGAFEEEAYRSWELEYVVERFALLVRQAWGVQGVGKLY